MWNPAVAAVEAEVLPQPGGFGEDLGPDVAEQAHVAGDAGVAPDRVGDIGVDVILRGARLEIRRDLLAVDRAPREQRALLADRVRAFPRPVQHAVPETEQVTGDLGLGVGQERQHVHLGVPEVVPLVGLPGQPLRRDARPLRPPGRLRDLEQVPPDGLLLPHRRQPPLHPDVGPIPEPVQVRALGRVQRAEPVAYRPVQGPAAPIGKLGDLDAPGGLVGRVLGDPDGRARPRVRRHDDLAGIAVQPSVHVVRAGRIDHVVDADGQRHPAVRRLVAQHDALPGQFGDTRVEHPVRQQGGKTRIARPVLGTAAPMVAILPVQHQRADRHRRCSIQHRHLVRHRHHVPVLERDSPVRADPDVLTGGRGPDELAAEDTGPHIKNPRIPTYTCSGNEQRLVIDVELDDRHIWRVNDRLALGCQRVRLLRMHDRPRLVKAVDECPRRQRRAPLLEGAPGRRQTRCPARRRSQPARKTPPSTAPPPPATHRAGTDAPAAPQSRA